MSYRKKSPLRKSPNSTHCPIVASHHNPSSSLSSLTSRIFCVERRIFCCAAGSFACHMTLLCGVCGRKFCLSHDYAVWCVRHDVLPVARLRALQIDRLILDFIFSKQPFHFFFFPLIRSIRRFLPLYILSLDLVRAQQLLM